MRCDSRMQPGGAMNGAMEPLLDGLLAWRELIGRDRDRMPNNRHFFLWRVLVGNRVSAPLSVALMALIIGGTLQQHTMEKISGGIRMAIGFMTIVHSLLFWSGAGRLQKERLLLELDGVARALAPHAQRHRQDALARVSRFSARSIWLSKTWTSADTCSLVIPLCTSQDEMAVSLWPWPPGRAWVVIGGLMLIALGTPFAFPSFLSVAFHLSFVSSEVALYGVLAEAVRRADTPARVKQVAEMDVRLTALGVRLKDAMAALTATVLTCILILPLFSTVLAFMGQFDLFTLVSIPYVMLFIMLCVISQDLQDSCELVGDAAYCGQWPEVRDAASRTTILVMMSRRGRPLGIRPKMGVDTLSLAVCRETMRSWYSLLQLLMKFF